MITSLVVEVLKYGYTIPHIPPNTTLLSIRVNSDRVALILEGENPPGIPMNLVDAQAQSYVNEVQVNRNTLP